jgi:hypothetical protein
VDPRRTPKWVLDAYQPDQRAQLRLYLWPTSPSTRFPTPVAAKGRHVRTQERLGPNDPEHLQGRWKPVIQPNKEPSIMVRQPDATMHPTPQDNQLMSAADRRDRTTRPGTERLERATRAEMPSVSPEIPPMLRRGQQTPRPMEASLVVAWAFRPRPSLLAVSRPPP